MGSNDKVPVNAFLASCRDIDDEIFIPFAVDTDGKPIMTAGYAGWLAGHEATKQDRQEGEERARRRKRFESPATKKFVRNFVRRQLVREIKPIVNFLQEGSCE